MLTSWGYADQLIAGECKNKYQEVPCSYAAVHLASNVAEGFVEFVACVYLLTSVCRCKPAPAVLKDMWNIVASANITVAVAGVVKVAVAIPLGCYEEAVGYVLVVIAQGSVGIAASQPKFIRFAQSWLMSRGEAASAAASIAVLLGDTSTEQVLTKARDTFMYVTADKILQKDMAENTPNPELSKLADLPRAPDSAKNTTKKTKHTKHNRVINRAL